MKATMIKKLNIVLSLWLSTIIAVLIVFGYRLNTYGFYIAGGIFAIVLLSINVFTMIYWLVSSENKVKERETEYRKY